MGAPDWWSGFFTGTALESWRRAHTRDESRAQAGDIARALGLAHGQRVLDVPCGNGRLALELAAQGFGLGALDQSAEFVAEARAEAAARGLELELHCGDMRALPWRAQFEAAFCAGNSFGYFEHEGNRAFLESVARALRPGARFLLEYPLVAELVLTRRALRDWRRLGTSLLLTDAQHDARSGRLETTYTFVDLAQAGGTPESRTASYQVYTAREVRVLLEQAGFARVELLGDLEGRPFEAGCGEFHALATRA